MKKIANFGGFVREFWWVWVSMPFIALFAVFIIDGQRRVTLDAKHWECVMAVPDGLGTRCTEYIFKGK